MNASLRHRFEAGAFRLLLGLSRLLPRRAMLTLGSRAGDLGRVADRRHRRIALENLQRALPETGEADADRILRDCWRHFGRITLDTLYFGRLGPDSVDGLVNYEGLEHIRDAYARQKGVLLFSGHFGHWELTALMQGHLKLPLALITRPLDNPILERMLAELRGSSGNFVVHKRNAVREMIRYLRQGNGVAIVIDQDARHHGVFVPFFGMDASTTPTLARVALRTGAPIIPTFSVPQSDGSYRIVYEPEVVPEISGDKERDIVALTERCTAIIERWVREHPELWLWMHRRWKTRPPAE